jgi:outer membrane protein OmpA-like peptidoglycan-associated protein
MIVAGPQRGLFLGCLGAGIGSLLLLDLYFAPESLGQVAASDAGAPSASLTTSAISPSSASAASARPEVKIVIPAAARVPTIVARFESEATEPTNQEAIRTLAAAMIEDHAARIVLEGHSDIRGNDDYNHEISLGRAEWVKSRLVALGVSADRIETVGLGRSHPLRSDEGDAQAVNRRVEVRWVGR